MAEPIYLEMPTKNRTSFLKKSRLRWAAIAIVLLSAVVWWWFDKGYVSSEAVVLEEYPVRASQPPIWTADEWQSAEHDKAASLPPRQPDMQELDARLKSARDIERELTLRLTLARNEEDTKRGLREDRVTEHVRSQLALRTIDAQGGAQVVGKDRYEKAVKEEQAARSRKDSAAAAFELASRSRAALDQELTHIRDELRQAGRSREPVVTANAGTQKQADTTPYTLADAPSSYWVTAYYPVEYQNSIKPGQSCDIWQGNHARKLRGEVAEVLLPQDMPKNIPRGHGRADSGGAPRYLPVRVKLQDPVGASFVPGEALRCRINTRGFPHFR